jgi:hypothetical protein
MAAMLKVYADRLSQPSRALIIFCRHVPTSPSDLFKRVPSSYRDWSILSVGWTSSISRRLPSIWARASTAPQSSRVRTVPLWLILLQAPLAPFLNFRPFLQDLQYVLSATYSCPDWLTNFSSEINPMGQVPVIVDGRFRLFERSPFL